MAKSKIRDELLDELLQGAKTQEALFGPEGVIKRLTGALVERALRAELSDHLDQERQQGSHNRRNGASSKTLQSPLGLIGHLADGLLLANYMRRFLVERAQELKAAAESDSWKRLLGA